MLYYKFPNQKLQNNFHIQKDLIGFVGAPWTILVYMLNRESPKKDFKNFISDQNKNELVSSMHSDLKNGRPIEIKAINGAISDIAKSLNIQAPINETIYNALEIYNQNTRNSLEENRR